MGNLTQFGRESGIKKLMMINLLKRLESSVAAFRYTLIDVVKDYVEKTLKAIEEYELTGLDHLSLNPHLDEDDFDLEDSNFEFSIGKKNRIALQDMDYRSWKVELEQDFAILTELEDLISKNNATRRPKTSDSFYLDR